MASEQPTRNTMICLDCGYPLDGLPSPVCPECGSAFDPADATTFQRVLPDPVRLARLPITEAYTACTMLERNGVPGTVHKESGGVIGYADLPQGSLWVDRPDESRARELLSNFVHQMQHAAEPWTCPDCGEHIEGQFELCWSCGAERTSA